MPGESLDANKGQIDDIKKEQLKILLDEGNISFDRSLSAIESVNSKILSLFEIYLILVTFLITMLLFLSEKKLPWFFNLCFLIGLLVLMTLTIHHFYKLTKPKTYEYIEIFEKGRFEKLLTYTSGDLLSDFVHNTQKSYQHNQQCLEELSNGLKWSNLWVILTFVYFVITFLIGYIFT